MNIIFTILFLFISGTVYAQECTQPSCFQQKDKELTGLANTTSAADRVPWYIDANGNMDLAPFTAFGRSIVGAANAGEVNTILGVSLITTHPRVTVATLPAVPVTNEVVVVTDALAASSCIVNGGTTNVTCQWTGTAWVAIGGGGGGGAVAGTDTEVQFNDSNIMAGDAGLTYDKASNVLTVTGDVIVAGQSVCQEDGTNCPSGGAPAFNTVTAGTNTDKLVIGTGGTLGVSGTGTITPQYTPSGNIAATTVQGAIAELDNEKQSLNTNLTTFGALNTDGVARRAAGVWVSTDPSLSPCGVDAAPRGWNANLTPFGCADRQPLNSNLTVLAAHPLAANTLTLLDSADFAAWRTNLSLVPGTNVQAFDAQLTDIAGLTPTDNRMVGSNATNLIFYTIEDCPAGRLSYNAGTHTLVCNASSGGIGGSVTSGPFAVGSGTDTVADSQWLTEGVSGIAVTGQSTFGTVGTNDFTPDYSGITGHKTGTYPNASGTFVYKDTNDDLTNKTISYSSNAITLPDIKWFDAAACQDATASHVWDYLAAEVPAVACDTGTNTQKAYLAFDDATDEAIQFKFRLGAGFQSINWTFRWKGVATAGAVGWCVQLVRVPDGATSDPAFPAQGAGNCVSDTAKGTTLQENEATITSVTCTSCAAGDLVYGRLSRDANGGAVTDSFSGDAFLLGWERTIIYTH